jgi:hypothetical protein
MICLGLIFITNIVKFSFDMFLCFGIHYSFNFRITLLGFLLPMNYQEYLCHHRTCPNNAALSYRDSRAYNRIATNPAVITNGYGGKAFS